MKPHLKLLFALLLFTGIHFYGIAQEVDSSQYTTMDVTRANEYILEATDLGEKKKYKSAIEKLTEAEKIYRELKELKSLEYLLLLEKRGGYYLKSGQFKKAIVDYEKILPYWTDSLRIDHVEYFSFFNELGTAYFYVGKYKIGTETFEKAIKIGEELLIESNPDVLASSYNNLGVVYRSLGRYEASLDVLMKALEIRKKLPNGNKEFLSTSYNNVGIILGHLSRDVESLEYYQTALDIRLELFGEMHALVAESYNNIGITYLTIGYAVKPKWYLEKAIEIGEETLLGGFRRELGRYYTNFGTYNKRLGDLNRALEYHLKALKARIDAQGPDHADLGILYNNIAVANSELGRYEEGKKAANKGLEILLNKVGEKDETVASLYNTLGSISQRQNNPKAIDYYRKSLEIKERTLKENHRGFANSYNSIGFWYYFNKDYEKALANFHSSLEVYKNRYGMIHPSLGLVYHNLGKCYWKMGNKEPEAVEAYLNAIKAYNFSTLDSLEKVNDLGGLASVLAGFGNNYLWKFKGSQDSSDLSYAQKYLNQSLSALNKQFTALNEFSRDAIIDDFYDLYDYLIELNETLKEQEDYTATGNDLSFQYAERSKSYLLYQSVQDAQALQFGDIADSLLEKELYLRSALSTLEKEQARFLRRGKAETDPDVLAINAQILEARLAHEQMKAFLEKEYPKYFKLKYDLSVVDVQTVQEELLTDSTTLLEYFIGDSTLFIFVLNKEEYEVVKIKKDFSLTRRINQMKKGLLGGIEPNNDSDSMYVEAAVKLYDNLIKPVQSKLKGQLVIIPDGVLGYLPFQALLEDRPKSNYRFHSHRYLGLKHRISYSYSATLLKEMKDKKHQHKPKYPLLAVAPFYDGTGYEIDSMYVNAKRSLGIDSLAGGTIEDPVVFQPLIYSGEEVGQIGGIWEGRIIIREEATKMAFEPIAKDYKILHLATHGQADDKVGEYAFLAFTEVKDSVENEYLYIKDIYNLNLNADLVVLSACETGIGDLKHGEGIISLARAFAFAGAKSITNTLWSVDDEKTKDLMIDYHRQLHKGLDKSTALWKAQMNYLKVHRGYEASPYFWAAFTGIGDMSPIRMD